MKNIFKWRVRLVQKGYDLGWEHGYQEGMSDKHSEIVQLLVENIENIDWLNEEHVKVRNIVPMVKNHKVKKESITWNS